MCYKPTGKETHTERMREELARRRPAAREVSHETGPANGTNGGPAGNTHPRGNGEADHGEVERGLEKLSAVLPH